MWLLHFLGSRAGSYSSRTGVSSLPQPHCIDSTSPALVHSSHRLVPTVVLQEPIPSSSQSCRRRSSAAQPLKTGHIHCVGWSLHPQVKQPHVALSTEVCDLLRLVVFDEGLVLAQTDLISRTCDLGNAQERTLHWANFPDDPAALSLLRSASHRLLASRRDGISSCASEDLTLRLYSASVESTA